jgi:hypothetical protein
MVTYVVIDGSYLRILGLFKTPVLSIYLGGIYLVKDGKDIEYRTGSGYKISIYKESPECRIEVEGHNMIFKELFPDTLPIDKELAESVEIYMNKRESHEYADMPPLIPIGKG